MECKNTYTSSRGRTAFTLVEMLVSVTLVLMVITVRNVLALL